uniref:Uncharacterized protein n=1 Tax=Romanomermis culicivorax TaxID=13658 RepID=A0A915J2Y8_ROMCU
KKNSKFWFIAISENKILGFFPVFPVETPHSQKIIKSLLIASQKEMKHSEEFVPLLEETREYVPSKENAFADFSNQKYKVEKTMMTNHLH